jgi:prepilin-type processing-associated H-X9-DG protein
MAARRLVVMVTLALAGRAGAASIGDTLRSLAAGTACPATVKLGSLDAQWVRLSAPPPADMSSIISMMMTAETGGPTGLHGAFYTKGDTIAVGEETFLVGYRWPMGDPADLMRAMMQRQGPGGGPDGPPVPPKPSADSELQRILVSMRNLADITDIRPFDLAKEVAEASKVGHDLRQDALNSASVNNLKQLGLALLQFAQDNNQTLPRGTTDATLRKDLLQYTKTEQVFSHPGTGEPYHFNASLAGAKLAAIANPAATVAFYEASNAPDGTRGVAFVDGHVARLSPAEWAKAKADSKIHD